MLTGMPSEALMCRRMTALAISLRRVSLLYFMFAFTVSNKNSIFCWLNGSWKVENSFIFALNSFSSGPEENCWWSWLTLCDVFFLFSMCGVCLMNLCSSACWRVACKGWWAPSFSPWKHSRALASLSPSGISPLTLGKVSSVWLHSLWRESESVWRISQ